MGIQVIRRDGQPEYAVVPWEEYQALLAAAGQLPGQVQAPSHDMPEPDKSLHPLSELAQLRQAKALEADALARKVGISPVYLALIESGERRPDAAILRSLAWELGIEGWSEPA